MGRAIFLPAVVLLIIIGIGLVSIGEGYTINQCYCWEEMDGTLNAKLSGLSNLPNLPKYHYNGIKPQAGGNFGSCVCDDVTRVHTTLKISSIWIYEECVNVTDTASKQISNLTEAINAVFNAEDTDGIKISVRSTFLSADISPETSWYVEVITRGREINIDTMVTNMFKNQTLQQDGSHELANVGIVEDTSMNFEVIKCPDAPGDASIHGIRTWEDNLRHAGVRATYSCDSGYFISEPLLAFSECSHENLTWTEPAINITCKRGCQEEPDPGPFFTIRNWNPTLRSNGDLAIYTCMDGYKPERYANGSCKCNGNTAKWSAIEDTFKCIQILCPENIPQVPAHSRIDWDNTHFIGTEITYSCIENYVPSIKSGVILRCTKEGKWTTYPWNYRCINIDIAIKMGYFDDASHAYDYYEDYDKKEIPQITVSYFFIVTIPSMLAMGIAVLLCLCCTRINSWLYVMCTGNAKKTSYVAV